MNAAAALIPSGSVEAARQEAARAAANHIRLGFEIEPGLVECIPGALLPIRAARGEAITTVNLDPSHLMRMVTPMESARPGASRA